MEKLPYSKLFKTKSKFFIVFPDFTWTFALSPSFFASIVSLRTIQHSARLILLLSPTALQKSPNEPEMMPRPHIGRTHLCFYSTSLNLERNELWPGTKRCCQLIYRKIRTKKQERIFSKCQCHYKLILKKYS